MFFMTVKDDAGQVICDYEGYVPDFTPNDGSDYLLFEIDLETGLILGWKDPNSHEDFKKLISNKK